jgi:hypothetical protein
MKANRRLIPALLSLAFASFTAATAVAALKPEAQVRVDARIAAVKIAAADPEVIAAVVAQNAALPAERAAMTQALWGRIKSDDQPLIRALSTNAAAKVLQAKCGEWANEAFVSDSHGIKVAFLSRPTNWSHAGKPKHEEPMAGHVWQGTIEADVSTGLHQLQVAVPVMKDGVPIGSLVVGLNLAKL